MYSARISLRLQSTRQSGKLHSMSSKDHPELVIRFLEGQPESDKIKVTYQALDFFQSPELVEVPFDLIYDYT